MAITHELRAAAQHAISAGRTITDLGQDAQIDRGNLSAWLAGRRSIGRAAADRLAAVLGCRLVQKADRRKVDT